MDIKGNNKYLIIVLIIIVIVCVALASFLVLSNNNNTDDSNKYINNTTTNTTIASEVNTPTSTSSEEYDPWGYGNDVYHYDVATDTYMIDGSDYHYIYDKVYDEWLNADTHGQFKGSTQQIIDDYIDTVEG